jgi:hypothetical protein
MCVVPHGVKDRPSHPEFPMPKKHSSKGSSAKKTPKARRGGGKSRGGKKFVKWFRHYITGEIIRAEDYGLEAFPLG